MKKLISIVLLFQLLFSTSHAQFMAISKADSLREAGDIKGAIEAFKILVNDEPNALYNMYNYCCALSVDRQLDSCFKYLYKSIEIDTSLMALTDKDFYTARKDKRWKAFEDKLVQLLQRKGKMQIKNWEEARQLWKMNVYDQAYYDEIKIAGSKLGFNSPVSLALMDLKHSINEKNQEELELLIDTYGWPKASDVGADAASAAFLIVQHSTTEKQKKYLSIIKKLCEEKEARWSNYALMYDRIQIAEKKPQKYGSQFKVMDKTKTVELFPLEDESKVDEWRKEVGLQPLADYLKMLKKQYEPRKK